ncbi:hypothetical protein BC940DRAFT_242492 [Gongronella butleri]|nr:hypothetical protein BC940DRAFT_242492 [Gongronella butleri]
MTAPEAPPKRVSSYQRLKDKLVRVNSEKIDRSAWPLPKDQKELWQHATKGGTRAFVLAYGVRAGINFCLYLLRVFRKKAPLSHIFAILFKNLDALRFGAMIGSFTFLWKLINNGLRLYRQKDDRWHGFVAGAVAGLSILFEKRERRVEMAQQLFARDIFYMKNGDALLFGLTCAQVMYGYTMQPASLPPDFYSFMIKAARCPEPSLKLNCKNIRGLPISTDEFVSVVQKYRPTARSLQMARTLPVHPDIVPCEVIHPWLDSCNAVALERFTKVFKSMMPVYGTLHFVPMIVLRNKHLKKEPVKMLSKTTIATLKSGAFLATFVTLYQYQVCGHRNLINAGLISGNSKYLYYLFGFVCSYTSIFWEDKRRRGELALYVLPKAIYSFYNILYQKKMMIRIPHFEVFMTSVAMGTLMVSKRKKNQKIIILCSCCSLLFFLP